MIKNTILCCLTIILLSGCGVIGAVVDTTGKVVGAGFVAAIPNQGTDDE